MMSMELEDLLASNAWKLVSEALWDIWKGAMLDLRRAKTPADIARADAVLGLCETLQMLPTSARGVREEDREHHRGKLEKQEERVLTDVRGIALAQQEKKRRSRDG